MTRIIYERDIDEMLLNTLERPVFARHFLAALRLAPSPEIKAILPQVRHVGSSGTIDLELVLTDGALVLIENKIDARYSVNGDGVPQPMRYRQTQSELAAKGIVAHTVLLAPASFFGSGGSSGHFDHQISYEDLLTALDTTERAMMHAAIEQANAPYEPDPNAASAEFFQNFSEHVQRHWPHLVMKPNPNGDGVRPTASRTIYFDTRRTLQDWALPSGPRMSLQCWDSAAAAASAKIMLGGLAKAASERACPQTLMRLGGYLRQAGQSLAFTIDTPRLETQQAFAQQLAAVDAGLTALSKLQSWWNAHPGDVAAIVQPI